MAGLNDYSSDDLREELARRERIAEIPKLIENPNYSHLEQHAQNIVDEICEGKTHRDDDAQFMFECVMETLLGEEFFNWYSENT